MRKIDDDCVARTKQHLTQAGAHQQDEKKCACCARMVRCAVRTHRRVIGGLPSKREAVKTLARTITHATRFQVLR